MPNYNAQNPPYSIFPGDACLRASVANATPFP